jgi:AcrR family transcriptional regulator/DNA-binding MarR family transcriptional regulator
MEEAQRTRILEAMAEAMVARAPSGLDWGMSDVLPRAGVTSAVFHEAFPDRESCLLATFELGVERARRRMLEAYDVERRWLDAIRAGIAALLRFLEDEPALGRVLVVYSLGGGERVLRRRVRVMAALAAIVDRGRLEGRGRRRQTPTVIAEGVVGAVLAIIQNRLLAEEPGGVLELFGSLVSIVVLPYLGAGVARRELTRPMPAARPSPVNVPSAAPSMPERASGGMRLTYRTARVLRAIAETPGASNREVADRAGITDQGQISKLLGRLAEQDLIEKTAEGRARGAPNAWRLTDAGERALADKQLVSRS